MSVRGLASYQDQIYKSCKVPTCVMDCHASQVGLFSILSLFTTGVLVVRLQTYDNKSWRTGTFVFFDEGRRLEIQRTSEVMQLIKSANYVQSI